LALNTSSPKRIVLTSAIEEVPPPASDDGRQLMRFTRSFLDTHYWQ
jgi:hypothetical protein